MKSLREQKIRLIEKNTVITVQNYKDSDCAHAANKYYRKEKVRLFFDEQLKNEDDKKLFSKAIGKDRLRQMLDLHYPGTSYFSYKLNEFFENHMMTKFDLLRLTEDWTEEMSLVLV